MNTTTAPAPQNASAAPLAADGVPTRVNGGRRTGWFPGHADGWSSALVWMVKLAALGCAAVFRVLAGPADGICGGCN